ncbi:MAG TPA: sensor histidine kinase, partial [Anaerolineales bacterium]
EEERRRIRRDLHDGLGPSLASQTFKLDAALDLLENDSQAAAQLLTSLKVQNQRLVAEIRRLVYELRPPALDELGLSGALVAHAGQLNGPNILKIAILAKPDPLPVLPAAVEVAAYRIALEGITNVVRHAHARECTVTLEVEKSRLMLTISDDGVGLPPEIGPGVGLASMRERAEELGGSIEVVSGQAKGTRVTAVLPMAGSNEQSKRAALEDLPGVANIISEAAGLKE